MNCHFVVEKNARVNYKMRSGLINSVKLSTLVYIEITPKRLHCAIVFHCSKSETFFGKSGGRIGGEYMKVVYVEYTDNTFATKKERTRNEKHLGILGTCLLH